MHIRTPYNYNTNIVSQETGLKCVGKSRTRQSDAEDADIDNIMRRFKITGVMPQGVKRPMYGDFEDIVDFRGAQDAIIQANKSFYQMTSEVRKRFGNDPQQFLEFCSDDKNIEEMRKMGLAVPGKPVENPPA